MGKRKKRTHIPPEVYDWLIENCKITIKTNPNKPNYMKIFFEPRKKRGGK